MQQSVSASQCDHIKEGMRQGCRMDGRTLLQLRQNSISFGVVPHTDGSCEVSVDGTVVLASVSVGVAETPDGNGQLRVHLDCSSSVSSHYARAMGGHDPRYQKMFFSHLSNTITRIFCATTVVVVDNGTAEAITDSELESVQPTATESSKARDFPAKELSLGSGFAYCLDADVQVLQCNGGNIIGAVCLSLKAALKSVKLPLAVLHETPAGVSVEVDKSRPYAGPPIPWGRLPTVVVAHWIPGYYLVDPSLDEELALPHRAIVASSESGRVSSISVECLPSRKGGDSASGVSPVDLRVLLSECVTLCDQLRHDSGV